MKSKLPNVKHVIAVYSCKGGVGKSMVASNLACALASISAAHNPSYDQPLVGLFDADIHGPSLPQMMVPVGTSWAVERKHGVNAMSSSSTIPSSSSSKLSINRYSNPQASQPGVAHGGSVIMPIVLHNIKCMSYGFVSPGTGGKGKNLGPNAPLSAFLASQPGYLGYFNNNTTTKASFQAGKANESTFPMDSGKGSSTTPPAEQRALAMRGPMLTRAVRQLLMQTDWGKLDYLIIDLPPGTGDVHLTICQEISIDAAVVVTTPQRLSFVDVVRGVDLLGQMKVPTIAVVENMSTFTCEHGKKYWPFGGHGDASKLANMFGIAGGAIELPIVSAASYAGDNGIPFYLSIKNREEPITATEREMHDSFTKLAKNVSDEVSRLKATSYSPPVMMFDKQRNALVIRFFEAAGATEYTIKPPAQLRRKFPEVDTMLGKSIESITDDIIPLRIEPRGNYAVSIEWSDGHTASIYSYEDLRKFSLELQSNESSPSSSSNATPAASKPKP